MAKPTKSRTSANPVPDTLEAAIVTDENNVSTVIVGDAAGTAGSSVPAVIDTTESESTSEGSSDPAAPAPADAIEGDTDTGPAEGDGSTSSDATQGHDQTEADAATASVTSSEPSQGAADDDGSMAGAVHALVIEAGAENVEQLLQFAELGRRLTTVFGRYGQDVKEYLRFIETYDPGENVSLDRDQWAALGVDVDEKSAPASAGSFRVKSTRDGFRRAGLVHSKAGKTFKPGELTDNQFKALKADPAITIEYL